jgi:hypothetical protein
LSYWFSILLLSFFLLLLVTRFRIFLSISFLYRRLNNFLIFLFNWFFFFSFQNWLFFLFFLNWRVSLKTSNKESLCLVFFSICSDTSFSLKSYEPFQINYVSPPSNRGNPLLGHVGKISFFRENFGNFCKMVETTSSFSSL